EERLVAALVGLVNPGERMVYVVTGHGEPEAGPGSPVSTFLDYIRRQNVTARSLALGGVDEIPADAAALLIIGPSQDFSAREIEVLSAFMERGGSLLVLLDPRAPTPRLDSFLAGAGIRPRDDRVLRTVRLGFATGILREVTAEFHPRSPITRRMAGLTLFLPGETKSLALEASGDSTFALYPLLQPLEEFWGESDYITDERRGVRYDEGRDAGQPLFVAAGSARGGAEDGSVEIGSSKLVVVGNCEFALDAALSPAGLDFLVSATHWLLDRGRLAAATPKTRRYFPLHLTDEQMSRLNALALLILPGCAAGMALLVWWRRRAS
ncbi:MAG: GldG family protein, partial [Terrimicrobiaceae bacterium]|nr:GldG family protein [Terrimicrobiaceae bacterium]